MGKRHQLQCRRPDVDPDIFFSTSTRKIEQAKLLCAMCPAQHQCLLASFARPGELGTWGGMTQDERAALVDAVDHAADLEPATDPATIAPDSDAGGNGGTAEAGRDADTPAAAPDHPDLARARRDLTGAAA